MKTITQNRLKQSGGSTISTFEVDGVAMGYIVEDGHNDPKIPGETRIPAGTYELKLRKEGGFHQRYSKRFGDWHIGMLELQNVPGFTYILIHPGNTKQNTEGCLLPGAYYEDKGEDGYFVGSSVTTYKRFYPGVAKDLDAGERWQIKITDEPKEQNQGNRYA